MGVLYRAEDSLLGRTVALKFLPPALTPNPGAKDRLLNEARAAAALDHPNICTIYEVGETAEGQLYLAMACYEGETLQRRLERGPLPAAEALHIALQVAHGLARAHRQGIVHRDIKPANLMITADDLVKILDFGIAHLPDQAPAGPILGSPGYMSPEQARAGAVDERSDVWSLGVVLREMLTGRRGPARPGASEGEEPPASPLPADAPAGTDRVLSRMLAEDPADRYPDAAALLADLAALERAAAPAAGRTAVRRLARRLRVPAGAVALVAMLAVAGGSWRLRGISRQAQTVPAPGAVTLSRLTELPGREWFPSLTPDGSSFVFAHKRGDRSRLFLREVGGGAPLDLLPGSPEGGSQPALSPDGRQIAFRSEREGGGLFLMGLMGGSVRRISDSGFNPAWSPDGKEIVFATEGVNNARKRRHLSQLYRLDLATRRQWLIQADDAVQPSWSPHGHRIAYWSAFPSGVRRIWTIPADGGEPVAVTMGESVDWNPVWSHDGRHLYFTSDRSGVANLWRVPIDERSGAVGEATAVTTSGQTSMLFSLSRDGRRIAYSSDETRSVLEQAAFAPASGTLGAAAAIVQNAHQISTLDVSRDGSKVVYKASLPQEDLFVVQTDGAGWFQLTDDRYNDRNPRWSPDGKRVAFSSNRDGPYEIWIIGADGSQLERAALDLGKPAYHPIWSPDGRWIACDLGVHAALIDLDQPAAERRPRFLPSPGPGLGFSASSWSADGRWLAGALHRDEKQLPGVVLYSFVNRRYMQLTDRGESATWLSDSRRLLYRDGGRILLLDAESRTSRLVRETPAGSEYSDVSLSPDDRILYLARNTEEGDIWLRTTSEPSRRADNSEAPSQAAASPR